MAGTNISTMSIQVGLDGTKAEQGLNRLGRAIDSLAESFRKKNDIWGNFAGNALWDGAKAGISSITSAAETLFNKLKGIGQEAITAASNLERVQFQDQLDKGASVSDVVNSDAFQKSILGNIAKVKEAWQNLMEWIGQRLGPVVNWMSEAALGLIDGVKAALKSMEEAFSGLWDGENPFLNVETIFKNAFNLAVASAKAIVEGAKMFTDLMKKLQLMTNPVARLAAEDEVALETGKMLGGWGKYIIPGAIDEKEFNRRQNKLLEKQGPINEMNKMLEDSKGIDAFFAKLQANLELIKPPEIRRKPKDEDLAKQAGLKVPEKQEVKFDPSKVFAPLMERGGMEDWRQTQIQSGVVQDLEMNKFKETMKKQDELKAEVSKVTAAIQAINMGTPFGVVAFGR